MKWIFALVSCSLSLFLFVSNWQVLKPEATAPKSSSKIYEVKTQLEIGLYDLSSGETEHYDANLKKNNDTVIISFTKLDDASFLAEGELVDAGLPGRNDKLKYKPIHHTNIKPGQMIDGLLDSLNDSPIELNQKDTNGKRLAVVQTGVIFLQRADLSL